MHSRFVFSSLPALICLVGCASTPSTTGDASQREMLALLMPSKIEIVQPFTRVKSFDDDSTPDGIEVLLQAVNSLGNRGLMIAGHVRVELYEHVAASGDQKGRRLEHWDVPLTTRENQLQHWNAITQMYEFLLRVDPAKIPTADKYVLAVVYNSPLDERLTYECVITHRPASRPRGGGRASGQ
jgi:hypothetical protein